MRKTREKSKQERASGEKDVARRCFLGTFTQGARGRECDWMFALGARLWVSKCGSLHHLGRLRAHVRIRSLLRVCLIPRHQEAAAQGVCACVYVCVCVSVARCRGVEPVIGGDKEVVTLLLWLVRSGDLYYQ